MAEKAGLEVKGMHRKVRTGISPEQFDAVQKLFQKNDITWQAIGRKDRVISCKVLSKGKNSKITTRFDISNVIEGGMPSFSRRNER